MIRVKTPSRLHFGMLSMPSRACWINHAGQETVPVRRFGGAGLMVQAPGVGLTVEPSAAWSAQGPLAERALAYARTFIQSLTEELRALLRPQRLIVDHCAPEHAGLGSGTQLGLTVARALATVCGLPDQSARELARRIGRGARSAIGIHGFDQGGFIVDAGKGPRSDSAPLAVRLSFPETWRLVLAIPSGGQGLHGLQESQAFDRLHELRLPGAQTDALCRLVLLGMVPALAECDFTAFGEALFDFNARAGELFTAIQGGTYANPRVAELVTFVRRQGVAGVGQSSWGPTVFALVQDHQRAEHLAAALQQQFSLRPGEVCLTAAANEGVVVHGADEVACSS